jgi:hypothetical protein
MRALLGFLLLAFAGITLADGLGPIPLPTCPSNQVWTGASTGCVSITTNYLPIIPLSQLSGVVLTGTDNRVINPEMAVDQRNEGAANTPASNGAFLVDHWFELQTQASKITFQRSTTNPPTGYSYSELITTASAVASPGATDQWTYTQKILGQDIADYAALGTASAPTLQFEFLARASASGTYCAYIHNNGRTRSYVIEYSVPQANTWYTISSTVLGDTSGTWASIPSLTTYGIEIGFDLGAGSNFQTTAGAWQGGNFTSTTNCTGLVKTGAATLQITRVRFYQGSTALPYVQRPYGLEVQLARRYYQKSFPPGTQPAQSGGLPGATCVRNPIAVGDPATFIQFVPAFIAGTPALTTYNPSAANANWRNVTAGADATVSVDGPSAIGPAGVIVATSGTVATLGDYLCINWAAVKEI